MDHFGIRFAVTLVATASWYCILNAQRPKEGKIDETELQRLVEEMGDDRDAVRNAARRRLDTHGTKVIPSLISRLGDTNDKTAYGLSLALQHFGEASVPGLIRTLKSNSEEKTIHSLRVLEALGEKASAAIPELARVVTHRSYKVRRAAVDALGSTRDLRALPMLIRIAHDDGEDYVREGALSSLTLFQGNQLKVHVRTLVALGTSTRKDVSGTVKNMAFAAVTQAGGVAIPCLVELIEDKKAEPISRIRAIGSIQDMAVSTENANAARGAIGSLVRVLGDENLTLRKCAADALGKIGVPAKEAVVKLEALAKAGLPRDRVIFANAILGIDHTNQSAMAVLLRAAEQTEDKDARLPALQGIREHVKLAISGEHRLIQLLVDPDPDIQLATRYILEEIPSSDKSTLSKLRDLSESNPNPDVRKAAARILRKRTSDK